MTWRTPMLDYLAAGCWLIGAGKRRADWARDPHLALSPKFEKELKSGSPTAGIVSGSKESVLQRQEPIGAQRATVVPCCDPFVDVWNHLDL